MELDSIWRCRFCSNPTDAEFVRELVTRLEEELYCLFRKDGEVKSIEAFIRRNSKDLYIKHYINLIAQRHIVQLLGQAQSMTREEAKKCVRHCKSFQSIMSRLDPGLSEWNGFIIKTMNKAQLTLLKMDLDEKKLGKNSYAEESEQVWATMEEVERCEILCTPVSFSGQT